MRNLSAAMQSHLDCEVTTLCRCWLLTRKDGAVMGFTDHDGDIVLNGVNCRSVSAMEASAIEDNLGLKVDSQEVSGALQSSAISDMDIAAGKYDGATIEVFVVNWANVGENFSESSHVIGDIIREDGHFRAELRSHSALLDQSKGRHFVKNCQADLGDGECGVNIASSTYTKSGSVTSVESPLVLMVSGINGLKAGWFRGGLLNWASGDNSGQSIEVAEHYLGQGRVFIHLWKPMANLPKAGDSFLIIAGCDKSFSTCKAKFSNSANFRGFPHLPGNDFASSYASNSQNLDGGPLIK